MGGIWEGRLGFLGGAGARCSEDMLLKMSDAYAHVDSVRDRAGYALIRTYAVAHDFADEYGVPEQNELAWTKTLKQMQERLMKLAEYMRSEGEAHPDYRCDKGP